MKTKGTYAGKVGTNSPPGASIPDTSRKPVGGQIPPTQPLPTMADQHPWLTVDPTAKPKGV